MTAAQPPAIVAAIVRSSSARKSISRVSSARWVAASEVTKNVSDTTMNRLCTCGWSKSLTAPEMAMHTIVMSRPEATLTQKAVDRSASVSFARWMSAAPSARSANTSTNDVSTRAIDATPYSVGVNSRASTNANPTCEACRRIWEAAFQRAPDLTSATTFRWCSSSASAAGSSAPGCVVLMSTPSESIDVTSNASTECDRDPWAPAGQDASRSRMKVASSSTSGGCEPVGRIRFARTRRTASGSSRRSSTCSTTPSACNRLASTSWWSSTASPKLLRRATTTGRRRARGP